MSNESRLILITGGTGKQGGAVARELLAAGHRVRVMTRNPKSATAQELASLGAEIVKGDLDDASSLPDALRGVWGAFALQNTWEAGVEREEEQGKRFAEAAHKAGVQHYVYASVGSAHRETGIPHFENKARVEQRVRELGFPSWTVSRPAFFMENFLSPDNLAAIANGQVTLGINADTRLQMIAVEDIGKYGKLAFEQPERFNGRSIDLAGDELTMREVSAGLSEILNRPVAPAPTPIEQTREWSQDLAIMLEWFDAVGYNADIAANAKEFGIQPTRFADWAARHASTFQAEATV